MSVDVAPDTQRAVTLPASPAAPPDSAGDGGQLGYFSPAEKSKHMSDCNQVYVGKVYDEPGEARDGIRETSESARHTVAEVSRASAFGSAQADRASIDRGAQDRYLANQFTAAQVAVAQMESRLQKDNVDGAQWAGQRHSALEAAICGLGKDVLKGNFDLATAVERNGRSAELATEKTAAATQLSIEKTAAAALLDSAKNAAAAALCCCETEARIAASTASILAAFQSNQLANLERQLTVLQARQGIPLSATPVG